VGPVGGFGVTRGTDDGGSVVAAYPMVEEDDAAGRVAAVYADLLAGGMPFVPSLFKSLALCPAYLVLAHDQAAGVLADPRFAEASAALPRTVRSASRPPPERAAREALARFVPPLAQMLLLTAGLREGLDGRLRAPPARSRRLPIRPVRPPQPAPSTPEAAEPALFGEIRAALRTPIVNSIWRSLASSDQLGVTWRALGPQVAGTGRAAEALQRHALDVAAGLPWKSVADAEALRACEVEDAAAGMRAVLTGYLHTLPRVLTLAASSVADGS
jgi:hypothetical protein